MEKKLMINIGKLFTKLKDFYQDLKYYIKNIYKWSSILWKDKDWDYYFIFDVLRFKIEKTRDYIQLHKRFVGWEQVVSKMNLSLKLINLVKEEYYNLEYLDYYKQDFFTISPKENGLYELKSGEVYDNNLKNYFNKYKNIYNKFKHLEDEMSIALKISTYNHSRAKRILFNLLNNEIEKWWD